MLLDPIEGLGLVAGCIAAFAYAPQAVRILRTGHANDVSALTYSMVLAGALLWGCYGLARGAVSIVVWNGVAALLAGAVLYFKVRRS